MEGKKKKKKKSKLEESPRASAGSPRLRAEGSSAWFSRGRTERSHAIHVTVPPGASLREPISHFNVEATPVPACSRSWNANLAVNMANNKRERGRDRCLYFIFVSLFFTVVWYSTRLLELNNWPEFQWRMVRLLLFLEKLYQHCYSYRG